ncbi:MAG: nucleotidyltransferase [Ekhidna sp.]|nr:nucleotidyltransferase [Ekhidna sp.]MBC6411179.1 nucleotidyltransferase [Ekhidna sp.]MBC6425828.1 nucleotidyltransferase [Ekhidna sp.]
MSNDPSLVVLAAGLGSRYGRLKQIDKFGPNDETLVDYTIYDAISAGFKKIIFVIRASIEEEFKRIYLDKLSGCVQVEYIVQELDALPPGFKLPKGREKPWGTAHAVYSAREKINEPFAIVNADDFYGRDSLQQISKHLQSIDNTQLDACLVGFILEKTLSDHGRVSRGVCEVSPENKLLGITERTHIYKKRSGGAYYVEEKESFDLTGKEIVSMNLMGFTSKVLALIESMLIDFLRREGKEMKSEFFIPSVLNEVQLRGVSVPVLTSKASWFGVTYQEDKSIARLRLAELVNRNVYPQQLWR